MAARTNSEIEKRIARLEREIAELKARPAVVTHLHYNAQPPYAQPPSLFPLPQYPYQVTAQCLPGLTCGPEN